MHPSTQRVDLWFETVKVGRLRSVFCNDATWWGLLETSIQPDEGELQRQILKFIDFCQDWNQRIRQDAARLDELDRYADLLRPGSWFTRTSQGGVNRMTSAPSFFSGGDVSWRVDALA